MRRTNRVDQQLLQCKLSQILKLPTLATSKSNVISVTEFLYASDWRYFTTNPLCAGGGMHPPHLPLDPPLVLFSPLSPFRWPQNTWPWMTLNGLKSHFTSYVHYYKLPRTNCLLLIYCSLFITRVTKARDQRMSAGSGIANSDPQNIGIHRESADLPCMDAISSEP